MFSDKLRMLRKANGYTQQRLADLLHIQRSTYSYYENGKTRPDFETLVKLSVIFNTDIEKLLEHEERTILEDKSFSDSVIANTAKEKFVFQGTNPFGRVVEKRHLGVNSDFFGLSSEEKSLLCLFRRLPEKDKEKVFEFCYASIEDS